MSANTYGKLFRLTTFGESHGKAVGGVIDGCPAGLQVDFDFIREQLERRRPGQSDITTPRSEADEVEFLSGIFEGFTTGAPIAFLIRNTDVRSEDYEHLKKVYRPSHAGFTWDEKYGFHDWRGGGRASARETVSRVAGGAVAQLLLLKANITVQAYVSQVGKVKLEKSFSDLKPDERYNNPVRCPDDETAQRMMAHLDEISLAGDTTGGVIDCVIRNVPAGLGEPVFDKLQADLAKAMMSINAAKGFEYGEGFAAASMLGSEHNDPFIKDEHEKSLVTKTNHAGGILGGISTGSDIYFRVAFKPVATIMKSQLTTDKSGNPVVLEGKGRHDVCVVPRAVPVVEAMAALVIADHWLRNRSSKL
jgi:chorismate synthase